MHKLNADVPPSSGSIENDTPIWVSILLAFPVFPCVLYIFYFWNRFIPQTNPLAVPTIPGYLSTFFKAFTLLFILSLLKTICVIAIFESTYFVTAKIYSYFDVKYRQGINGIKPDFTYNNNINIESVKEGLSVIFYAVGFITVFDYLMLQSQSMSINTMTLFESSIFYMLSIAHFHVAYWEAFSDGYDKIQSETHSQALKNHVEEERINGQKRRVAARHRVTSFFAARASAIGRELPVADFQKLVDENMGDHRFSQKVEHYEESLTSLIEVLAARESARSLYESVAQVVGHIYTQQMFDEYIGTFMTPYQPVADVQQAFSKLQVTLSEIHEPLAAEARAKQKTEEKRQAEEKRRRDAEETARREEDDRAYRVMQEAFAAKRRREEAEEQERREARALRERQAKEEEEMRKQREEGAALAMRKIEEELDAEIERIRDESLTLGWPDDVIQVEVARFLRFELSQHGFTIDQIQIQLHRVRQKFFETPSPDVETRP